MPIALAISPHLDDAVFSAGGTLARFSRGGWRVVVATVFTASVPNPTGFAMACQLDKGLSPDVDYMAMRREEDAAACSVVGASALWLPFKEAPHRGYHSAASLFDGLHDKDRIVEEITPRIASVIEELSPDLVLAPLCVGAHVDHVAAHLAVRACGRRACFWIDFPYVARAGGKPSPFLNVPAAGAGNPHSLRRRDLESKIEAAGCYKSQLSFQFGGERAARDAITSFASVERFIDRVAEAAQIRPEKDLG